MTKHASENRISRRDLFARMVAFGLSLAGVRALAQGGAGALHRPRSPLPAVPWDSRFELAVTVQVREGGTRRPYVVVWLEDEAGKPVRTVRLWVQKGRRRWIQDLSRWFRLERERKAAHGGDLIDTLSGPTRQPGRYTVRWDGKTDDGKPVEQGSYFVCVESVREGGTDHLIRQAFTFGTTPFQATLEGSNPEISEVRIDYRQRAAA